jgi:hypothetical protein
MALLQPVCAAAHPVYWYGLTAEDLAAMETLPKPVAGMLTGLVGMQYPQRSLFDAAVVNRLADGIGCPAGRSSGGRQRLKDPKLSDKDMEALAAALDATPAGASDEPLGRRLRRMHADASCHGDDKENWDNLRELYGRYRGLFEGQVRKAPAYAAAKPLALDPGLCGCNTGNLKGEIYRFYPFWLGGVKQTADLSLVSHVEYYGVSFDDSGTLLMANDGRKLDDLFKGPQAAQLDFITEARRHRVKVDWVIQRSDWSSWTGIAPQARKSALDRLAGNIAGLLKTRMTDLQSRLMPWISFGMNGVPGRGDGVTLYFDGYPANDPEAAEQFHGFVDKLSTALGDDGLELNIMMRRAELGNGIYGYARLADRVKRPRFLVLMEEPTALTKKQLRMEIEIALHGAARMELLRQIVPVINFDGENWPQLQDDIVYVSNNFAGIGLWPGAKPQPSAAAAASTEVLSCEMSKNVDKCIRDYLRDPPGESTCLACNIICEYRWWVRFVMCLLVLALIVLYVRFKRRIRERDERP